MDNREYYKFLEKLEEKILFDAAGTKYPIQSFFSVKTQKEFIEVVSTKNSSVASIKTDNSYPKIMNETKNIIKRTDTSLQKQELDNIQRDRSNTSSLEELKTLSMNCTNCELCQTRTQVVFSDGNPQSKIMIIGEGPGKDEDKQGKPFVGRAGKLFSQMLLAIGIPREEVYITNIVKCRPPENRNPKPDEIAACQSILQRQIEFIQPKIIVLLGAVAWKWMFPDGKTIGKVHGQLFSYQGISVMPLFHPAYLLRRRNELPIAWKDMKALSTVIAEKNIFLTSKKHP